VFVILLSDSRQSVMKEIVLKIDIEPSYVVSKSELCTMEEEGYQVKLTKYGLERCEAADVIFSELDAAASMVGQSSAPALGFYGLL